jgi:hypothetical protein
MSHVDTASAYNARAFEALHHWILPDVLGEHLCVWNRFDQFGYREDWDLIKIYPECLLVS